MKHTKKKTITDWRSFKEARTFVHTLGLKNVAELKVWTKNVIWIQQEKLRASFLLVDEA